MMSCCASLFVVANDIINIHKSRCEVNLCIGGGGWITIIKLQWTRMTMAMELLENKERYDVLCLSRPGNLIDVWDEHGTMTTTTNTQSGVVHIK